MARSVHQQDTAASGLTGNAGFLMHAGFDRTIAQDGTAMDLQTCQSMAAR